jgi:hypothetical protein
MTTATVDVTTTRCSFCGLPETSVAKLIAGPGVYICDGCVGKCETILHGDPPARLPLWETMTDEEILAHIPRIAAVANQVEQGLRDWVGQLRERGVTWGRIGTALGIARQSAWGRFSGEE